jgi:hypothetical protein
MAKLEQKVQKIIQDLGYTNNVYYEATYKMWTRGDGARYKDKASIRISGIPAEIIFEHLELCAKRFYWITQEFPRSPKLKAIVYKSVLFVLLDDNIEVATTSVLSNTSVWKLSDRDVSEDVRARLGATVTLIS